MHGVSVTWSGRGGSGRATSDGRGNLSLGFLPPGTYEIAFETPGAGAKQPSLILLVGLLAPAGPKARTASRRFTPGVRGRAVLDVGADGQPKSVRWAIGDSDDVSDVQEEAPSWSPPNARDTRLVFAVSPNSSPKVVR
jgi:hypothetical protein